MSVPYRYREAGRIKIGDVILLEDRTTLEVGRIERDEADPRRLIFIDERGDVATLIEAGQVAKIMKRRAPL